MSSLFSTRVRLWKFARDSAFLSTSLSRVIWSLVRVVVSICFDLTCLAIFWAVDWILKGIWTRLSALEARISSPGDRRSRVAECEKWFAQTRAEIHLKYVIRECFHCMRIVVVCLLTLCSDLVDEVLMLIQDFIARKYRDSLTGGKRYHPILGNISLVADDPYRGAEIWDSIGRNSPSWTMTYMLIRNLPDFVGPLRRIQSYETLRDCILVWKKLQEKFMKRPRLLRLGNIVDNVPKEHGPGMAHFEKSRASAKCLRPSVAGAEGANSQNITMAGSAVKRSSAVNGDDSSAVNTEGSKAIDSRAASPVVCPPTNGVPSLMSPTLSTTNDGDEKGELRIDQSLRNRKEHDRFHQEQRGKIEEEQQALSRTGTSQRNRSFDRTLTDSSDANGFSRARSSRREFFFDGSPVLMPRPSDDLWTGSGVSCPHGFDMHPDFYYPRADEVTAGTPKPRRSAKTAARSAKATSPKAKAASSTTLPGATSSRSDGKNESENKNEEVRPLVSPKVSKIDSVASKSTRTEATNATDNSDNTLIENNATENTVVATELPLEHCFQNITAPSNVSGVVTGNLPFVPMVADIAATDENIEREQENAPGVAPFESSSSVNSDEELNQNLDPVNVKGFCKSPSRPYFTDPEPITRLEPEQELNLQEMYRIFQCANAINQDEPNTNEAMASKLVSIFGSMGSSICGGEKRKTQDEVFEQQLRATVPVEEERDLEIAFTDWRSAVLKPAYAIIVDHSIQAVIVILRSSVSFVDIITDLICMPYPMSEVPSCDHGPFFPRKGNLRYPDNDYRREADGENPTQGSTTSSPKQNPRDSSRKSVKHDAHTVRYHPRGLEFFLADQYERLPASEPDYGRQPVASCAYTPSSPSSGPRKSKKNSVPNATNDLLRYQYPRDDWRLHERWNRMPYFGSKLKDSLMRRFYGETSEGRQSSGSTNPSTSRAARSSRVSRSPNRSLGMSQNKVRVSSLLSSLLQDHDRFHEGEQLSPYTEETLDCPEGFRKVKTKDCYYVHEGILVTAKYCSDAIKDKVLGLLEKHRGYRLILTGHSLGAGTAALLDLFWRNSKCFEGIPVKTYAFACPCICSTNVPFSEHMISVVEGNDAICRLSIRSVEHLRQYLYDILPLLSMLGTSGNAVGTATSSMPGETIMGKDQSADATVLKKASSGSHKNVSTESARSAESLQSVDSGVSDVTNKFMDDDVAFSVWQTLQAQKRGIDQLAPGRVLLPAGKRIFFIQESQTQEIASIRKSEGKSVAAAAVPPSGVSGRFVGPYCFDDFVIAPNMFAVHSPDAYDILLRSLAEKHR